RPQQQQNDRQSDQPASLLQRGFHPGNMGKGPFNGVTETVSSSRVSPDVDSTSTITSSARRMRYTTSPPANRRLGTRPRQAEPPLSFDSCSASGRKTTYASSNRAAAPCGRVTFSSLVTLPIVTIAVAPRSTAGTI